MRYIFSALILLTAAAGALAGAGVEGVFKTETSDEGGYLEITFGSCQTNASKTCGVITAAYNEQGLNPGYEHLGKLMVKDMTPDGDESFSGGTIWDPEKDKTYKSKMQLEGQILDVEGCIAFFCDGQDWTRVD